MMWWLTFLSIGIAIFSLILLVRNELIFRIRNKGVNNIHAHNMNVIYRHTGTRVDFNSYGSYEKMLWSLHKWTYKSFYGDIDGS